MNVYSVKRTDKLSWCQDEEMIVIAYDEKWAEKIARQTSDDFRHATVSVTKLDLNQEGVVLISNTGA